MNNFDKVSKTIKVYCNDSERPSKAVYEMLSKIAVNEGTFLPLDFYLETLDSMNLIKFASQEKTISITQKGKDTTNLFF